MPLTPLCRPSDPTGHKTLAQNTDHTLPDFPCDSVPVDKPPATHPGPTETRDRDRVRDKENIKESERTKVSWTPDPGEHEGLGPTGTRVRPEPRT